MIFLLLLGTASSLSATGTKTTTNLSSSLNPSVYGEAVTFTAVVNSAMGAPPDGDNVTFEQGTKILGTAPLSGGSANLTISTFTAATDNIKAVYSGDSTFAASTSNTVKQLVSPATTTTILVSSQNPSGTGQSVTFTAVVAPEFAGTATGTVGIYNGSTKLGSVMLSGGVANYATTKLPVGTNSITAVYNGSIFFETSTSMY